MRQVVEHVNASNRTRRNGCPQTRQNIDCTAICYTYQRQPDPSIRGRFATAAGISVMWSLPRRRQRAVNGAQVKAWSRSKIDDLIRYAGSPKCPRIPTIPAAAAAVSSAPTKSCSWRRPSRHGTGTASGQRRSAKRACLPRLQLSRRRDMLIGCLIMSKAPTTETIAAELTVPERVLLFCLASDTIPRRSRRRRLTDQVLIGKDRTALRRPYP
jgi:hypothetical protein